MAYKHLLLAMIVAAIIALSIMSAGMPRCNPFEDSAITIGHMLTAGCQ